MSGPENPESQDLTPLSADPDWVNVLMANGSDFDEIKRAVEAETAKRARRQAQEGTITAWLTGVGIAAGIAITAWDVGYLPTQGIHIPGFF